MKALSVILTLSFAACIFAQKNGYKSKYDNIDIDAILNNQRVLQSYVNCFLDKGPCTPEGREGKKFMPEIYRTSCAKCSDDQKFLLRKTIKAFIAKRKDDWKKIVEKYDPEHKGEEKFLNWVYERK